MEIILNITYKFNSPRKVIYLNGSMDTANKQHVLRWRQAESDCVLNHWRIDCFLGRVFTDRSKKTSNLRVTDLCEGNSPDIGEFPTQRASNGGKCFHLITSSCEAYNRIVQTSCWQASKAPWTSLGKWPDFLTTKCSYNSWWKKNRRSAQLLSAVQMHNIIKQT